ncbi:MAG: response regulator transcription factor [Planctomycetota bacterium]|nr:response regulator transcription factor [Planctomycetota bacterium]
MVTQNIVVVEDDPDLLEVLRETLAREGYLVHTADNGLDGLRLIKKLSPDLVCLDLMMPGMDGIEVCRELRADKNLQGLRIMMLTAKGDESDVVLGLGIGADDYVIKPARPKELIARIRALLRRPRIEAATEEEALIKIGPLEIDDVRFQVRLSGAILSFTPTEYQLLKALALKPERAFTRTELLKQAGGAFVEERTVDAHIKSVRKKLGDHAEMIQTVRGRGYTLKLL